MAATGHELTKSTFLTTSCAQRTEESDSRPFSIAPESR